MIVIGLISGTSVDGIDAVLVDIQGQGYDLELRVLQAQTYPYPAALRAQILAVCEGQPLTMAACAELDDAIATVFAQAALAIQAEHPPARLIGSHGQTVYHRPPDPAAVTPAAALGYSLQLGRGSAIAHHTGILTVSNFRAADLAHGGQGAPLVPPIDVALFSHPQRVRCIQNLGGIGNVTYLPVWDHHLPVPTSVVGWDTGPGNALLDMAVSRLSDGQLQYDDRGQWAAQGTPCLTLVDRWLQHDFFQLAPPKSTGRELFSAAYLTARWQEMDDVGLAAADRLATLADFTAASVAHSYQTFLPRWPDDLLLCGGGSRNDYLQTRLQARLPTVQVGRTEDAGIPGDFKEAIAFAVLGFWRYQGTPGNLPSVTGAQRFVLLGDCHG